jgi:hypothetical protein
MIALAIVAILAAAATTAGGWGIRRLGNRQLRAAVVAVVSIILAATPVAVEFGVARISDEPHVLLHDLRWPFLVAPVAVAVLAAWRIVRHTPRTTALWSWAALWGVLNTLNKCAPGWCGSYGFPLSFYSWSDAVVVIDGWGPPRFRAAALAIDVAVFVAPYVAAGIEDRARRRAGPE